MKPWLDWVDKNTRMPTAEDADYWGCVMIWDQLNGAMITGWRNAQQLNRAGVTHWARIPEGPRKEDK